jgi:predicted small lipoprotein YifL
LKTLHAKRWSVIILALLVSAALAGCGKKGPPVPPPRYRPPPVTDLAHRVDGGTLLLSWTVPVAAGTDKAVIDGCVVYRARQSILESECTGCPVPFEPVAEIPFSPTTAAVPPASGLTYTETLLPGFIYTYKVTCLTRSGGPGPDSNAVNFRY